MKELLEYIVYGITGVNPEVKLEQSEEEGTQVYSISVPKEKIGLIIGKFGRTAKAIRNLARIWARKSQSRVWVKISEAS